VRIALGKHHQVRQQLQPNPGRPSMSLSIRRILVAVADGTAHRVTRRAGELALESGAKIELFSVVRPELKVVGLPNATLVQLNRSILESRQRELDGLARGLRRRGLDVVCTVVTHDSLSESIEYRLHEAPADIVAIEAHKHHLLARWFLLHSDYDLIRHCPVPLLIVKGFRRSSRRPILAAIDPWHQNDRPASLDGRIVDAARTMAELQRVSMHSVHAYRPLMDFVTGSAFAPVAIPVSARDEAAQTAMIRRHFKAFNTAHRIAPRLSHLEMGDPMYVLPEVARSIRAQMVVMGAIARSRIDRLFLGSTAEQVLDALPCDVLIVKPKSSAQRSAVVANARKIGRRVAGVAALHVPNTGSGAWL
jgi:universal stress protein E